MFRKVVVMVLVVLFSFSSLAFAVGQEMTLLDKVSTIEKFFYGTEQTGALVERVNKLDKDVYGQESQDSLTSKVDTLYSNVKGNSTDTSSFLLRLNGVEWSLHHNVTSAPAKNRLENIERALFGNVSEGAFESRLEKLLNVSYSGGVINTGNVSLPVDMLIKIKMLTPVGSKSSRTGDVFSYQAAQDVFLNGVLVVPQGAQGTGRVLKVEEAKNFGRDGELQLNFELLEAVDGSVIPTLLGDKAKEENKSLATAAGASLAGMVILGPVGIVGGAFVHGKDINIPAGTEFYIQSRNATEVLGLQTK